MAFRFRKKNPQHEEPPKAASRRPRGIAGFFIAILFCLTTMPAFAAEPAVGQLAPALQAIELNGQTFDLAQMRGKVVIVNFWATWCGPCRVEMPALDTFYRAFRGEGLALIGVSVDKWDDRGKVAALMKEYSYPAAMINEAKENDFPRPKFIPTTYIIDRDGVLRAIKNNATRQMLAETVLPLLKKKSPPRAPSGMSASLD